jgi:diguanylate cyclase (GGDEF)-like protein/PAS domain S-box-containing protein
MSDPTIAQLADLQRAKQALEDKLHFIEQLIEAIPSPIFYKDENGRYLGCNRAYAKLAGMRREELVGKTAYDIWPEDSADRIRAIDEELLKNPGIHESQEYESSRRAADGKWHDMLVQKTTFLKRDGSIGGILGTMWDFTGKKVLEQMLREQALHDPLTTLYNRRYLDEILETEFSRAARSQGLVEIVMADIDHFKQVNDSFGHECGDEVLRVIAQLLRAQFRKGDIVCRYGGEEFTIVMPGATLIQAHQRAASVCDAVRKLRISCGERAVGPITMSFGVAAFPEHGDAPALVLKAADAALLRAKMEGRDQVIVADS